MKQRQTQRRSRMRSAAFTVSLVGYTNAGKSTLFNSLVKAQAYVADQLFATLDTTTRQLYLGDLGRKVSLSDTVGFIRDLPHGLVNAFAATLQEAAEADLLLHVVDCSNEAYPEQIEQVQKVLAEIGAQGIPQLLVFNKLDALPPERQPSSLVGSYELDLGDGNKISCPRIFISAQSGAGLPELRSCISEEVTRSLIQAPPAPAYDERLDH